jgi:hypothetical protein
LCTLTMNIKGLIEKPYPSVGISFRVEQSI